ncbi:hypothetical protein [Dyella sp.]|uniref:hypothetical protein n=1 Tax=Dyella sp. TaxID=1869338 RepID=UPI00285282D5|nr:hypothetical protein [Dyella sp.]
MLPILLALACAACFSAPEPPADLHFERFEQSGNFYALTFKSSVDFEDPAWNEGGSAMPPRLICSLDDDINFSNDHVQRRRLYGSIRPDTVRVVGDKLSDDHKTSISYTVEVDFEETKDNGTSTHYLTPTEISSLLASRTDVSCKIIRTFYFSTTRTYYSNTMKVPVKALLDAVNIDS